MTGDPLRVFDGIVKGLRIDGAAAGPLAGLAFVAKDLYDVRGYRTGAGNPDWERTHEPAAATAPAVERLLAAGAALIGKSCTDELAFSLDGVNVHYGTPLNPRFPDRLPGGSSSGSVSAVAAGLCDFAIGSDTSGSIRVPASYCGVYGFRPSHGRVPIAGVVPLAPSFDTVGWLARDAAMLARCGRALLGASGAPPEVGAPDLAVIDDAFDMVDARFSGGLEAALARRAGSFGTLRRVRLGDPGLAAFLAAFGAIKQWEAWRVHGDWIRAVKPDMAANIRASFEAAARVTEAERDRAAAERDRLVAALRPHLRAGAAVCVPSAWTIAPLRAAPAAELALNRQRDLALGSIAGLSRAPQVSIPVAEDGCAVGLSFIAAPGADEWLLGLAERVAAP
jgi:amidase